MTAVQILQATFELAGVRGEQLLPAGLHPTIPTLATFAVWRGDDWCLAQLRLSCRSGVRARQLVLAARGSAPAGWPAPVRAGDVRLERHYDVVRATVGDGSLDVSLADPRPLGVDDIQLVVGLVPAVLEGRGPRLVQLEAGIEVERAERGRAVLGRFDPAAWGVDERVRPAHPVAATFCLARLEISPPRFVLLPDQAAHLGTETV